MTSNEATSSADQSRNASIRHSNALWGDGASLVEGDLEAFQLSVEVGALNTEHPCSVWNTTAVLIKGGGNVLALEPRPRLAQGSPGG